MNLLAYCKDARSAISSNKMRSGLSMLGIIIGVSSVILLMSVGAGAQQGIMDQIGSLVNNNISISSQGGYNVRTSEEINGYVKPMKITTELVDELQTYFPELSGDVTYSVGGMGQAMNEDDDTSYAQYFGVPAGYLSAMKKQLNYGQELSDANSQNAEYVAIINSKIVDDLFPTTNPIGELVTVEGKDFRVIGVLKDENAMFGMVYVPIKTYQQRITGNSDISSIDIYLDPTEDNSTRQDKINYFLLRKTGVSHLDLAGFKLSSTAAMGSVIEESMAMFQVLLGFIGAISLLVGGIGVMNIMLVSVTERTREIGIRKAIGALNKDIIMQFLIESLFVTFLGGIFAILFSYFVVRLINKFAAEAIGMSPAITSTVVLTAFLLTMFVGILSGILPARKAAKLKPIDALRFE